MVLIALTSLKVGEYLHMIENDNYFQV